MNRLREYWNNHKSEWTYILVLFIVTRIVLSVIGTFSIHHIEPIQDMSSWRQQVAVEHPKLVMWAVWDSKWYLQIANEGYIVSQPFVTTHHQSIGFFPLYPMIFAPLGHAINDLVTAGLIVSNVAFLLAAYFLYQLIKLDFDEQTTRRSIAYLFLFPTAYIFSAIYAESLLLLLVVTSIYQARKGNWFFAGVLGFFAALTKPVGFILFVPIFLLYLKEKNYSWRNIRPSILFTFLIPLGLLSFGIYNYYLTGDMLAYAHIQETSWRHSYTNPFKTLWVEITTQPLDAVINAVGICIALFILAFGFKKIPFAYWMYALLMILFVPFTGVVFGSLRYLASIFPIIMILAAYSRNENADRGISTSMAMMQGFLAYCWVAEFWFIS